MALTDPELDLLVELLEDDPGAEVYLQVGEEYVRRAKWVEATEVLSNGLARSPDPAGFRLLARAALECEQLDLSISSLEKIDIAPGSEEARVQMLALERAGHLEEARLKAEEFLVVVPDDVVVTSLMERLHAPPPADDLRGTNPAYTVERAERYVAVGRADRAVRVYRRILALNPSHVGIVNRLRQLSVDPMGLDDDLSEELTDPCLVPPDLHMPRPNLTHAPGPSMTPGSRASKGGAADPSEAVEAKATGGGTGRRKRRRSLINR